MAERFPPLASDHDCSGFDCGDSQIDRYLQRHALTNHRRRISKTFVALAPGSSSRVVGYYSLAPTVISVTDLPPRFARGLPGYPIPGYLLARLGVSRECQGQGLGADLVFAAAARAARAADEVGGLVLLIEAKSESLAAWYCDRFGALALISRPTSVVLSLRRVAVSLQ